jgi:hypothetical protein
MSSYYLSKLSFTLILWAISEGAFIGPISGTN